MDTANERWKIHSPQDIGVELPPIVNLRERKPRGPSRKTRELMDRCRADGYEECLADTRNARSGEGLVVALVLALTGLIFGGLGAWIF